MSMKKLALVIAILVLLVGVVYGGYRNEEKSGAETTVVESRASETPDTVPEQEDDAVADSAYEEPAGDEEVIMSTSAGVAKRANAAKALEADPGN